LFITLIKSCSM